MIGIWILILWVLFGMQVRHGHAHVRTRVQHAHVYTVHVCTRTRGRYAKMFKRRESIPIREGEDVQIVSRLGERGGGGGGMHTD